MATKRLQGRKGQERRKRWLRMHPLCKHCADEQPMRLTIGTEVDHIIPLHKGGSDDDANLQTLCRPHHARKTLDDMGHAVRLGCDETGHPTDPQHPWNLKRTT